MAGTARDLRDDELARTLIGYAGDPVPPMTSLLTAGVRRRRRRLACTVTAAAVVVTAALGAGAAAVGALPEGSPAAGPATVVEKTPTGDLALQDAADELGPMLRERYADHFAGLAIDQDHRRLIIYRLPGSNLDTVARQSFPRVAFDFRGGRFPERDVLALLHRIGDDMPYWKAQGLTPIEIEARTDGSGIHVRTPTPDVVRVAFSDRYPTDMLTFIEATPERQWTSQ